MRKIFQWALAAALICSATAFTSCTNDDNPVTPDLNVAEKIIGKWMPADIDGKPALTNEKMVFAFLSPTKGYISASLSIHSDAEMWSSQLETDVAISGNKVTVTFHPDEHNTSVHELNITAINDKEFTANQKVTVTIDGNVVISEEKAFRFVKLTADYAEPILGLWECTGLIGIETYNDANARLEFLSDGTYRYYRKDEGGQWQAVTTREFQDYFVDGTLLATRWKNQGQEELREWWEIDNISGDEMVWTALRQNADGSTVQQEMTWKKIDLKVAEKIIGKWMATDIDGQTTPTNMKSVYTFVSTTKAYMSASFNHIQATGTPWHQNTEADVAISGNKVTLTMQKDEHNRSVQELTVTAINNNEFTASLKVNVTVDGNVVHSDEHIFHFTKLVTDYKADIVGTWEGRCTSAGSVFDDGQEHRWEYNADGTYVYYVKDGDSWVPYEGNTLNEYFVDGTLLCTRWIDQGQENREWWEITIAEGRMNWTALRKNPDGTTFTATFEMTKVE
jgi:archaellum component FlaG (FlaF/FlaG flagellin family)